MTTHTDTGSGDSVTHELNVAWAKVSVLQQSLREAIERAEKAEADNRWLREGDLGETRDL